MLMEDTYAVTAGDGALLAAVLNSLPDGLIVLDSEYTITRANTVATRMFGRTTLGEPCFRALHGRETPCSRCPAGQALSSGRSAHGVIPAPERTAAEWLSVSAHPLRNAVQEIVGVVEIVRDVTEDYSVRRRLSREERFRRARTSLWDIAPFGADCGAFVEAALGAVGPALDVDAVAYIAETPDARALQVERIWSVNGWSVGVGETIARSAGDAFPGHGVLAVWSMSDVPHEMRPAVWPVMQRHGITSFLVAPLENRRAWVCACTTTEARNFSRDEIELLRELVRILEARLCRLGGA